MYLMHESPQTEWNNKQIERQSVSLLGAFIWLDVVTTDAVCETPALPSSGC